MTIADFQPHIEAAIVALEWAQARAAWLRGLFGEQEALEKALTLAGQYGVEEAPLQARLDQIVVEFQGDVTPDRVSQHPMRSVPMDLIATAVIRRILRLPDGFPVLSIKVLPSDEQIADAVEAIAQRWSSPLGPVRDEQPQTV